jgi:hypothetical protein
VAANHPPTARRPPIAPAASLNGMDRLLPLNRLALEG